MFRIPIIEVVLTIISSWWAVVMFNTPNLFETSPNIYDFFSHFGNEKQLGVVFVVGAGVKIIGLAARKVILRKAGLLISAFIYSMISVAYFMGSGWFSIGFGTFIAIALLALWGIREVDSRNG
ncbi:hypothetical protein [Terribacillus saccharophilus]|uniref:hypothetical protein n=1 Tax=Terribacillus saccharophilus TaxID=361277 RepID=UPI000BA4E65E|nr:hypothetical protein [Terribacillus saccharophilus]PAF19763.1 hypothetical protein CHH51_01490 [Terribacillus saccharophilus]